MQQEIVPFDWYRIFIGDLPLLFVGEIIFRTTFLFFYTFLMARSLGKRGMQQITPFEFIIVIVLGSAAGDPMFYPNVPLIHGMAVLTTVVVLEKLFFRLADQNRQFERFIESDPALLIERGTIIEPNLKGNISLDELKMQLRMQGIEDVGQVHYAYLEPSGKLSVIRYRKPAEHHEKTMPTE